MKKFIILLLVFVGLFSSTQLSSGETNSEEREKPEIQAENVISVQVHSLSGITRLFKITDGYEERVLRKVTEWINDSSLIKGTVEVPK